MVEWTVDESQLASLAAKLSPGAQAAYGRGGNGWYVLITRLQEELLTFEGKLGRVSVDRGCRLSIVSVDEELHS